MLNALVIGSSVEDLAFLDDCLNVQEQRSVRIDHSEMVIVHNTPVDFPPYDIVFIDMDIHGIKALDDLRVINRNSNELPVIILSSRDKESIAVQAVSKGAKDYILKENLSHELLMTSIRHSLLRNEIEHELRNATKIKSKFIWTG